LVWCVLLCSESMYASPESSDLLVFPPTRTVASKSDLEDFD